MKTNVKKQILELAQQGKRIDDRAFDEFRPVSIEYDISVNAEGSAMVSLGNTKVNAGVKMDVAEPYPDSPNKGNLMVGLELSPIAAPQFEPGPPSIDSIEISRVIDRGVREANAVNFEKLCIKEGELVWQVFIDEYAIDSDGNVLDAGAIAAIAALANTKLPKLDEENKVDYKEKNSKKLELRNVPLACTVVKIENFLLVDPNSKEEEVADSKLTITMSEHGIHGIQKGNGVLTEQEIAECITLAKKATDKLRKQLKLK
ncbi:MAG: exosome complex protein Rrp42 [Candidatus Nanoarchaeia archaeon]|nr:exosome complex protein Rrp42 [Candidatus Nanoarchaeia archaeon]